MAGFQGHPITGFTGTKNLWRFPFAIILFLLTTSLIVLLSTKRTEESWATLGLQVHRGYEGSRRRITPGAGADCAEIITCSIAGMKCIARYGGI